MFQGISAETAARMRELEAMDASRRQSGSPRQDQLLQISPDTGRFVAFMAAGAPDGEWIEIGTSAGYSALWLSLAARLRSTTLTTYEIDARKVTLARATFEQAGVTDRIRLVHGDILEHLASHDRIAFCFLDTFNELYQACYDLLIPRMVPGGLLVADNAISHQHILQPWLTHVQQDPRVAALVVPVGKGELVCRKLAD